MTLPASLNSVQLLRRAVEAVDDLTAVLDAKVDVDTFGAAGDGTTDDSAAINSAIDKCLDMRADGIRANVVLGAKTYLYKTPHALMTKPVGIIGQGSINTVIKLHTDINGDAFKWSEVWYKTTPPTYADFGVILKGFSVIGDRSSSHQQNAFMFYDRTDNLLIDDVSLYYVRGRAFASGIISAQTQAYMRESRIRDFRAFWCGLAGSPVFELCTEGSGDSTNSNRFHNIDIFGSYSEGLVIRNKNDQKTVSLMDFYGLRIEGQSAPSPAIAADTFKIGDTGSAYIGGIAQLNFYGLTLIQPYTGQFALTIDAKDNTVGANTYMLNFHGVNIGPGAGGGINIAAGRSLEFQVFDNSVSGSKLTIAAAGKVGQPIRFDAGIRNWSATIDATSAGNVHFIPRHNYAATAAPTTSADRTLGYAAGSIWYVPTTGQRWICRDSTAAAAVWTMIPVSADHAGYTANQWYTGVQGVASTGVNPGANSIRLYPIIFKERCTITSIGVFVNTLHASGKVQAAIYANNPTTMLPTGNALVSTGDLSTTSQAAVAASVSLQVEPGVVYWMATNTDDTTAICVSFNATTLHHTTLIGAATQAGAVGGSASCRQGLSVAQTFNTWPDITAASFGAIATSSVPIVQFKVGSIP